MAVTQVDPAIHHLERAVDALTARAKQATRDQKRRLEADICALREAVTALEVLGRWGVRGKLRVTRLPLPTTQTAGSEFRLIEDAESDDPTRWVEVEVEGKPVRPLPGALILEWPGCDSG